MTEITRVPIQPVAKGSVLKLWLGVIAALLAAGGIAWATLPASVTVQTVQAGEGPSPTLDDMVLIAYKGMLPDGTVFDESKRAPLALSDVVPGFQKALVKMQKGGKYKVHIPSELGYGAHQAGPIPPNTDLNFEIELFDFRNKQEVMAMQQQMQQMQQQQGGGAVPPPMPGN